MIKKKTTHYKLVLIGEIKNNKTFIKGLRKKIKNYRNTNQI
jgi:hypothetical protein